VQARKCCNLNFNLIYFIYINVMELLSRNEFSTDGEAYARVTSESRVRFPATYQYFYYLVDFRSSALALDRVMAHPLFTVVRFLMRQISRFRRDKNTIDPQQAATHDYQLRIL